MRLDGIPLAIELAAARVRALSVAQISERLEHSLGLLSGRDRTVPERQRTLRAALDWSYGLLDDEERQLFGRQCRIHSVGAGRLRTVDSPERGEPGALPKSRRQGGHRDRALYPGMGGPVRKRYTAGFGTLRGGRRAAARDQRYGGHRPRAPDRGVGGVEPTRIRTCLSAARGEPRVGPGGGRQLRHHPLSVSGCDGLPRPG